MLVNSNEILKKAKKNNYAIAQFNINNLEWTKYILEECEKNNSPVILGVSEGTIKYMGGYNVVFNIVKALIKDLNISIPVVLHLDHGSCFESCKKAIDSGFTSVMIDASNYELSKNIEIVKQVCDYAKKHNVTVEAEIGYIGKSGELNNKNCNTTLEDSLKLYNATKIDTLAPALGSVHGLYKGKPNLDFNRMKEISNNLNIPLVLHGGTGIPDNDIKKSIIYGISKVNINTELQLQWSNGVKEYLKENNLVYDPRKIISSGEKNIKKAIFDMLHLLGSCNKI